MSLEQIMTFLLSGQNYLIFSLTGVIFGSMLFTLAVVVALKVFNLEDKLRSILSFALLALSFAAWFSVSYVEDQTKTENVTAENWVQIYSNNQKAEISLHFSPESSANAGEVLKDYQLSELKKIVDRNDSKNVTVIARKDGKEESRVAQIGSRNISIPSDKNRELKITKIEYRKIVGQRKTLFGYKGNISPADIDGEIKITIDGKKQDQSLKELFDGEKQ